jgi:hypothetical protein
MTKAEGGGLAGAMLHGHAGCPEVIGTTGQLSAGR